MSTSDKSNVATVDQRPCHFERLSKGMPRGETPGHQAERGTVGGNVSELAHQAGQGPQPVSSVISNSNGNKSGKYKRKNLSLVFL